MPRKKNIQIDDTVEDVSLEDLIAEIESDFKKKYKDDSVIAFSKYKKDEVRIWYPSGIVTLDHALGGGWAGGRLSEVYGLPGSGKSTTGYSTIAAVQQAFPNRLNVIVDPENSSYDSREHAELLGVDFDKVLYIGKPEGRPAYAEDMFERLEDLFRNPKYRNRLGIILIDSVGALVSKTEGESADKWDKAARVGGITHVISMFLRSVVDSGLLYESGAHIMCLNQVRDNIGDMFNPYRTVGGKKLQHTAAQRVEVSRSQGSEFLNPNFKEGNPLESKYIGQRIKFRVTKNKVGGRESATAYIDFYYGSGLDYYTNILNMAQYMGLLQGTTWLTLIDPATGDEIAKYQGIKQWREALQRDEELWSKIYYLVYSAMKGVPLDLKTTEDDSNDANTETTELS